ncbi:MAG: GNAT family N-acetyltransferase [Phycisphaerae bacterium]|nr:GNAT family N-acetyltransferase [Phycisphaerae bacterium]
MAEQQVQLIEPSIKFRDEYLAFVAEFDNAHVHGGGVRMKDGETFEIFLQRLADCASGVNIPQDYVKANTYWLVKDKRILGTCNLRHELNDRLRNYGGHIGYSIRPCEWNKGYGTELLRLAMDKARKLGISRALVTCDKINIGSARVIQKNGGVLDSEGVDPEDGKVTQRYWIAL